MNNKTKIETVQVGVNDLIPSDYNPRKWSKDQVENLKTSINNFGIVDPIIVNSAPSRKILLLVDISG